MRIVHPRTQNGIQDTATCQEVLLSAQNQTQLVMTESAHSHHPYPDDAIAKPFVFLHSFAHTCRMEYLVSSQCQNLDKYSALRLHIRIGLIPPLTSTVHRRKKVRGLSTRSFSTRSTKSDCEQRSLLLGPKLRAIFVTLLVRTGHFRT